MSLFFTIFFTLYSIINFYVFIRGWEILSPYPLGKIIYLFLFLLFSLSYIFVKIFSLKIPGLIHDFLLWIGSFWFAMLLYLVLILFLIDLTRLTDSIFNFLPLSIRFPDHHLMIIIGLFVISSVIVIITAGFFNGRNFKIKTFELNLPKRGSKLSQLNLVVISDIHLSPINNDSFLRKIISRINDLNADIILMPGDVVDDRAEILQRNGIGLAFKELKSKYGVFASTGNHEFINGVDHCVKFIREFGITVLRDEFIKIGDMFYIVGREDVSKGNFTGEKRMKLHDILSGMKDNLPIILLDHTPVRLNEAVENKIDLQLSGHTHNGQMFPLNFVTKLIYELSWGYLKKVNTHFYVSSGIGSWGPPVKLASDAEIINFKINFQ
jgi:uncharacterized protein